MLPENVKTAADALKIVEERKISHIKVGLFDMDGVLRGKYMSKAKFTSALEGGFGFCDVVLGWDSNDQLYDNITFTGWHTAFPDAPVRVLPTTCREIPFEEETLLFLAEFSGCVCNIVFGIGVSRAQRTRQQRDCAKQYVSFHSGVFC